MVAPLVLVASSSDVLSLWPRSDVALAPAELQRAQAIQVPGGRADFVAAHLLAREAVAAWLHVDASSVLLEQHCAECGEAHGRPSVAGQPDVFVSWSHSAGTVAAAVADRAVGVDVELVSRPSRAFEGVVRRTMTATEADVIFAAAEPLRAFLVCWTAKESLVKAGAIAMSELRSVDVSQLLDARASNVDVKAQPYALTSRDHGDAVVGTALRSAG